MQGWRIGKNHRHVLFPLNPMDDQLYLFLVGRLCSLVIYQATSIRREVLSTPCTREIPLKLVLQCGHDGQGTDGFVKSLFTLLLPALTSIPPAGAGFSRLTYCNVPKG